MNDGRRGFCVDNPHRHYEGLTLKGKDKKGKKGSRC